MNCRERLTALFDAEGVSYRLHAHEPTYTAQEEASVEHLPGRRVAKVVIAMADERPVMAVIPADRHVDLGALALTMRHATRIAEEDELAGLFLDCEVGAMPALGNLYSVPVYMDIGLSREAEITFLAGSHSESVTIATADFVRLAQPTRAPLAAEGAGVGPH